MKTKYEPQKIQSKRYVGRHVKICINCGNTDIQEYEFGISCELCGASFNFGKIMLEEMG